MAQQAMRRMKRTKGGTIWLGLLWAIGITAAAVVYVVVAVLAVQRIGRAAVRRVGPGEDVMVTVMLLIILFTALAGELVGINFIVGSFIAGLGLSRVVRQQDMRLFKRFKSVTVCSAVLSVVCALSGIIISILAGLRWDRP